MLLAIVGSEVPKITLAIGFIQFLTGYSLYIGWLWAIAWAVLVFLKSNSEDSKPNADSNANPYEQT